MPGKMTGVASSTSARVNGAADQSSPSRRVVTTEAISPSTRATAKPTTTDVVRRAPAATRDHVQIVMPCLAATRLVAIRPHVRSVGGKERSTPGRRLCDLPCPFHENLEAALVVVLVMGAAALHKTSSARRRPRGALWAAC